MGRANLPLVSIVVAAPMDISVQLLAQHRIKLGV
jgi:hypothetical protein